MDNEVKINQANQKLQKEIKINKKKTIENTIYSLEALVLQFESKEITEKQW